MKRRGCIDCKILEPVAGQWGPGRLCPSCIRLRAEIAERAAQRKEQPAPALRPDDPTAARLRGYLKGIASGRPEIWAQIDRLRADRGKGLPDWPGWCYMPVAGAYSMVSQGTRLPDSRLPEVAALSTLAAWRPTQGIYRYHPDVLDALWNTPVEGKIPSEVLHAIPEWCVYIETPGREWAEADDIEMLGVFAFLESDANDGHEELRLMIDTAEGKLIGLLPVHLGADLATGLERAKQEAYKQAAARGYSINDETDECRKIISLQADLMAEAQAPMVSLVLYLCSTNAEIRTRKEGLRPRRPQPVKTKAGMRIFAPNEPTAWDCGWRIGAAIEAARALEYSKPQGGTHASPRPHIRRAHWHSFWTGSKAKPEILQPSDRKLVLKWLPPIAVAVEEEAPVIPTVHRVEGLKAPPA